MGVLTLKYLLFVLIVFSIYWLCPNRYKKYFLLLSSLLFILSYGLTKTIYLLAYVLVIYLLSIFASNISKLKISIILCILPLFLNKYLSLITSLFNVTISFVNIPILGISFVCFRGISYIVDINNNKIKEDNLINYLLYMLLFPTLLSGPIEKAEEFINAIETEKKISWNDFVESIIIIFYGFIIKLVIADRLSPIINAIYSNIEIYTKYAIFAILVYPIYIYCDFAGYSYIAFGASKLFGYNVTNNFLQPYFSQSIKEFWNRWHSSLNNWFKYYIYIPLGGNRKGKFRKYMNFFIIFTISGIWHGSGLGFLIWGMLNALFQIIGEITQKYRTIIWGKLDGSFIQRIVRVIINYLLISITWIFFSRGFNGTIEVIKALFEYRKISFMEFALDVCANANSSISEVVIIVVFVLFTTITELLLYKNIKVSKILASKNVLIRYAVILILMFSIIKFGKYGMDYNPDNFIYFDF